jgi:hypothetical protein
METKEEKKSLDNLFKRVVGDSQSLHISRVPIKAKQKFIELANEEFAGDYGMLLHFLLMGCLDATEKLLVERIEELEDRVATLESKKEVSQPQDDEKKVIKTLSGKRIR